MKLEHTLTISDFARQKNCSRQTVYANIDKLDIDIRKKIIWNAKAKKWQPENKKINKRYKKGEDRD